jgi:hypothetical protein
MSIEECIKNCDDGVILKIRISPNSAKNQVIISDDMIKIKVTAQPIENKANKAVIQYLSKLVKIPKTSISILKGETSKEKTILLKTDDENKKTEIKSILTKD